MGYHGQGNIQCDGQLVSDHTHPSVAKVLQVGAVCNNAHIVNGDLRGQPTEGALLAAAMKVRDWSLITGRGGYKTGGGAREVLPLRKGGAQKVLAMLKGGAQKVLG